MQNTQAQGSQYQGLITNEINLISRVMRQEANLNAASAYSIVFNDSDKDIYDPLCDLMTDLECDGYWFALNEDCLPESLIIRQVRKKALLNVDWRRGYDLGCDAWEIDNCGSCSNPEVEMCPIHDCGV